MIFGYSSNKAVDLAGFLNERFFRNLAEICYF